MNFVAAFFLGLAGSLHCGVMCGPLALAIPAGGHASPSRLIYNAGRIATYALIGVVFGLFGRMFVFAGYQRALSISAGLVIMLAMLMPFTSRFAFHARMARVVSGFKSAFASLLRRRTIGALFLLGGLNGLLPCGLVYVGGTMAAASGSPAGGAEAMLAFGLGTLPMMLGIGLVKNIPGIGRRLQSRRVIFSCAVLAGLMLVLRGLALGIPYLSPALSAAGDSICSGH